jgi:hypothetical protein
MSKPCDSCAKCVDLIDYTDTAIAICRGYAHFDWILDRAPQGWLIECPDECPIWEQRIAVQREASDE